MAIGYFTKVLGCFSNGYEKALNCLDLAKKPYNLAFWLPNPILASDLDAIYNILYWIVGSNLVNLGLLAQIPIFSQLQRKRSDLDGSYD